MIRRISLRREPTVQRPQDAAYAYGKQGNRERARRWYRLPIEQRDRLLTWGSF
jgi:hypothetical protein